MNRAVLVLLLGIILYSCKKDTPTASTPPSKPTYWDSSINCAWSGAYSDTLHETKPYPHYFFELQAYFPNAVAISNENITFWVRANIGSVNWPLYTWTKLPATNVYAIGDSITSCLNAIYYIYGNPKIAPPRLDAKAYIQIK